MTRLLPLRALVLLALGTTAFPLQPARLEAQAAPLQFADLGTCRTRAGAAIDGCRMAYRTYGRLNAARDNAVLIPSWGFGRSEDLVMLLGATGWVDTARYFVITADKLGNGVSTSPSNSTTQPGRAFPRVTMEDLADAQHRLVTEHLKIDRLHAVLGWSMGGMQALAWAMEHPDAVRRVVSVAGTPRMNTYDMFFVRTQLNLVDFAVRTGMSREAHSTMLAELWHLVGTSPRHENQLPRDSVDAMIAEEIHLEWMRLHPEDNRIQLEALAAFDALATAQRVGERRASLPAMLLVYMSDDHVTTPENFRAFAELTGAAAVELAAPCGHMQPVCDTPGIGTHVQAFLAR